MSGTLVERDALRWSPAGVAVIEGRLEHRSEQDEAGVTRQVQCEMDFVCLGESAALLSRAPLGSTLMLKGFMAARSAKSRKPRLHVTEFEFEEGN